MFHAHCTNNKHAVDSIYEICLNLFRSSISDSHAFMNNMQTLLISARFSRNTIYQRFCFLFSRSNVADSVVWLQLQHVFLLHLYTVHRSGSIYYIFTNIWTCLCFWMLPFKCRKKVRWIFRSRNHRFRGIFWWICCFYWHRFPHEIWSINQTLMIFALFSLIMVRVRWFDKIFIPIYDWSLYTIAG